MAAKIDLECKIYLILADEKGHAHGEICHILNEDTGNLSKKLKELREERKTIYRTIEVSNYQRLPHYIIADINTFKYILNKISKHLTASPAGIDPRKTHSITQEFGDAIVSPNSRICQLIDRFIKSKYVQKIVEQYGVECIYNIFKEETHCYCDIFSIAELAEDLEKQGKISKEDFGKEFLTDLEDLNKKRRILYRESNRTLKNSPFQIIEFDFDFRDWTDLLKY